MSIKLTNLTKNFSHNLVVDRLSLEINSGELFVLLGGSGSGKSTVLRMIAGLVTPDGGTIELNNKDVTELSPQKRNVGLVFQNYSLFHQMTIAENIEFGLRIRRVPLAERNRRSSELLELVGLSGFGDRYPRRLSGGQQQRVALARALAYEPAVLLLDEPFGALDVKIRAQLRESLRDIQRELKITTVLVTHDQQEAFELGDRIGVIARGHLIEVGPPEKLYQRPQTETVATFLGGGNVLVGRKEGGSIRLGKLRFPFPSESPEHEERAAVRILFRPESVVHFPAPPTDWDKFMPLGVARLVKHVFTGSQQKLRFEVEALQGARVISPALGYGYQFPQIDLVETTPENGRLELGETRWLGVRNIHVLKPAGFRVLVVHNPKQSIEPVLDAAGALLASSLGDALLLTVNQGGDLKPELTQEIATAKDAWLQRGVRINSRVRQGDPVRETLIEAQEGSCELVVSAGPNENEESVDEVRALVRGVVGHARLPIMVSPEARPEIRHILICTAAGEPGKGDVQFGARLARQTVAKVTLFHSLRPGSGEFERQRAERHLERSRALLSSLGIESDVQIESGLPLPSIMLELRRKDYDMLVIGAALDPHSPEPKLSRLHLELLHSAGRPVVIVPIPRD